MIEKVIEIEAESLEEAREQLESQMPKGFHLLSEQVLSDGKQKTVQAVAKKTETAFTKAQSQIPSNACILEKKELTTPERKVITVEAFDETSAKSSARGKAKGISSTAIVESVKLISAGSKGFLGIGKKPNQYEVEILQQAVVEIIYKTKAKIFAKIYEKKDWESILKQLPIVADPPKGNMSNIPQRNLTELVESLARNDEWHGVGTGWNCLCYSHISGDTEYEYEIYRVGENEWVWAASAR